MDFLVNLFNVALYKPLFNALVLLYEFLPGKDFGIAIIVLTVLIRIILYPLGSQAIKSQKVLQELQPKIKEIQEKYKNEKEKLTKATLELYQKEKINPLSGCLPLLIQLPIIIALYRVFWKGFQVEQLSSSLYSFVPHISAIDPYFVGIIDLSKTCTTKIVENGSQSLTLVWPSIILVLLTGIVQFFQTKMTSPKALKGSSVSGPSDFSQIMQKQMLYFFPVFTVFILWNLPAAIALYWLTTTVFAVLQQYLIFKKTKNALPS